ncbi:MAG: ABC transporter permease, partial [Caulobacteraceae bacterium]|nr:ABC transporter permease [Caulobacteraceae bacterium]
RVMLLGMLRDRGAMTMTFLLPPLVFVIFATVFAGASGDDVRLKLAVVDVAQTPASRRLEAALLADPNLRAVRVSPATADQVRKRVRAGRSDAGLVIRADPGSAGAPFLIFSDPSRAIALPLTQGRVQAAMARHLPDVMLAKTLDQAGPAIGSLTERQQARANAALAGLRADATSGKVAINPPQTFEIEEISQTQKGRGTIAYYAGAVTILFALFSAMNAAMSLIEERQAGVADRILAGASGMGPVVNGKFLFLMLQGCLQAASIFLVAQIFYGVPVQSHFLSWLITSLSAAICAGGLALGVVALSRTREQAQMFSTFLILVLAAVGGSMVPRFLMPPWLQTLGWFTPHAWAIEAYHSILWRDAPLASLYPAWGVLTGIGLGGLLIAHISTRLLRR